MRHFLLIPGLIACFLHPAIAQERRDTGRGRAVQAQELAKRPVPASRKDLPPVQGRHRNECRSVFNTVREGLSTGNISNFAHHFGSQVSVNLRGAERGNYSGNQAYYILENYLRSRKVVYIDFSKFDESDANPFATGSVAFNVKGNRELSQVYVSLSSVEERWVITQINIY